MFVRSLSLLAFVAGVAVASIVPASARAAGTEPLCVLLLPDGSGDTLLNRCRTCREVMLQRVRDGDGIPNVRSLMLPGQTAVPAPFRGPGHTRMLGERTCPPPPGRGTSQAAILR
jgi:hypothetical protein